MTYKEAYYFKDEIRPMDCKFCFCGTLAGGKKSWHHFGRWGHLHNYSSEEYTEMERVLLTPLKDFGLFRHGPNAGDWAGILTTWVGGYEDALFNGMCAALDVLRQIHIERGENIDDVPGFTKRNLDVVV